MTSRRLEGYKNYRDVLKRHRKSRRQRRMVALLVLLLFFVAIVLLLYIYTALTTESIEPAAMAQQLPRPGFDKDLLQNGSMFNLNFIYDGKT